MSERFFSTSPITTEQATLDGAEAHHLAHVMRAVIGQRVTLFDGSGAEFDAVLEKIGRSAIEVRVIERREVNRELPFPLTIGVALPKGDRQKWLVEKLTELGVTTLVPLITERCVAQPTAGALTRLERAVVEAAKQCGRNQLMKVAPPQMWSEYVGSGWPASSDSEPRTERRLIAHPGGKPVAALDLKTRQATQLAIGPEGGLTDQEISTAMAAEAPWQTVDLGPRILRVETAAMALAAALAHAIT